MADVFISYARDERDIAAGMAQLLEALELSVFFDEQDIEPGSTFTEVLDREIRTAKVVVALWSPLSLTRPWVRTECHIAKERRVLIPVVIKSIDRANDVPANFVELQTVDLEGFHGDRSQPNWPRLVAALARHLNRPGIEERDGVLRAQAGILTSAAPAARKSSHKPARSPLIAVAATLTLAVIAVAGFFVANTIWKPPATAKPVTELVDTEGGGSIIGPLPPPSGDSIPGVLAATSLPDVFAASPKLVLTPYLCPDADVATCEEIAPENGRISIVARSPIRLRIASPVEGHLLLITRLPDGHVEVASPRQDNAQPDGQVLLEATSAFVPEANLPVAIDTIIYDADAQTEQSQWVAIVVPEIQAMPYNVKSLISEQLLAGVEAGEFVTTEEGLTRLIAFITADVERFKTKWAYGFLNHEIRLPKTLQQ